VTSSFPTAQLRIGRGSLWRRIERGDRKGNKGNKDFLPLLLTVVYGTVYIPPPWSRADAHNTAGFQMSQIDFSRKALALKAASEPAAVRTILRMPQVEAATGLRQSHIYQLISQDKFPRGVKLSDQAVGWYADEVALWQEQRPRAMGGWSPRDRKRQAEDVR
jgi:prophage regulatory protein